MTQYQLGQSQSPVATIAVTNYPDIIIAPITAPSSPQSAGAALACIFLASNGGGDGVVTFTLKNQAGVTLATQNIEFVAGQMNKSCQINFTMPTIDTTLTVTSNYGGSASKLIQVLLQIATTITLALSPVAVKVGDTVTASGKLSRNDSPTNYNGVASVPVIIYDHVSQVAVLQLTTNATGGFTGTFTAPSTAGTYQYHSWFAGSGVLASAFSTPRSLSVGLFDAIKPWVTILAPLAAGILLVTVTKR